MEIISKTIRFLNHFVLAKCLVDGIHFGIITHEDNVIGTEIEKRTACVLGASNNIGLIIGMTNFNLRKKS